MRSKRQLRLLAAVPAAMGLLSSAASAHTVRLGSTNAARATGCATGFSWVQRTTAKTSPSYVVPANGTITSWTTSATLPAMAALKIWRPTPNPSQFKAAAQSATEAVPGTATPTTFSTSIPVKKGDIIGIAPISGPVDCLYHDATRHGREFTSYIVGDPTSGTYAFTDYKPSTLMNVSAAFRAARAAPKRGG